MKANVMCAAVVTVMSLAVISLMAEDLPQRTTSVSLIADDHPKRTTPDSEKLYEVDLNLLFEQYKKVSAQLQDLHGQIALSEAEGVVPPEKEKALQQQLKKALTEKRRALISHIMMISHLTERLKEDQERFRKATMQLAELRFQTELTTAEGIVHPDKDKQTQDRRMDILTRLADASRAQVAADKANLFEAMMSRWKDEKGKEKSS